MDSQKRELPADPPADLPSEATASYSPPSRSFPRFDFSSLNLSLPNWAARTLPKRDVSDSDEEEAEETKDFDGDRSIEPSPPTGAILFSVEGDGGLAPAGGDSETAPPFRPFQGAPGSDPLEAVSAPSYELIERVGRGGMGEIWKARQASLDRLVAVKKLRSDYLDSLRGDGEGNAREAAFAEFHQEALATARLDHPGIVPVHDLGLDPDGRPLLAMKLVRGKPWDKQLKSDFKEMPPAEFLAKHLPVLVDAAQALAFAHSRGIIHRDFKPAQVMVGEFGETLLMDWGLALSTSAPGASPATEESLAADSLRGSGGFPPVLPTPANASNPAGTPALMAPEQTTSTAEGVGPWTDIYLLGGSLYWLLAGTYPHSTRSAWDSMRRAAIGDVEPPSAKVPGRPVPPELEALCLWALKAEPKERPASVGEFIDALQDYMTGASKRRESLELTEKAARRLEPKKKNALSYQALSECLANLEKARSLWRDNPQTPALLQKALETYAQAALKAGDLTLARLQASRMDPGPRRGKSLGAIKKAEIRARASERQRKILLAAVVLLSLAVAVGAGAFARRIEAKNKQLARQTRAAEQARSEAEKRRLEAEVAKREAEKRRTEAEEARGQAEDRRVEAEEARGEAEERRVEAVRARRQAEARRLEAEKAKQAAEEAEREAEERRLEAEEAKQEAETQRRVVFEEFKNTQSLIVFLLGELRNGLDLTREADRGVAKALGDGVFDYYQASDKTEFSEELLLERASNLVAVAERFRDLGLLDQSEALANEALELRERLLGPDDVLLAAPLQSLARVHRMRKKLNLADEAYKRAQKLIVLRYGGEDLQTAAALQERAFMLLFESKEPEEAGPYIEKALEIVEKEKGPDDPATANLLNTMAQLHQKMGRFDEARPLLERALAIQEKNLEPDAPEIALALFSLASFEARVGNVPQALEYARRSLAIQEEARGPDNLELVGALNLIGTCSQALGDAEGAAEALRRSLGICEKVLGPEHPDTAFALESLAALLESQKRFEEALDLRLRALRARAAYAGESHPDTGSSHNNLAHLYERVGRHDEAAEHYAKALAIFEEVLGPGHGYVGLALDGLGSALMGAGRFGEALPALERALAIWEKVVGPGHWRTLQGRFRLAECLAALAQEENARGEGEIAHERLARAASLLEGSLGDPKARPAAERLLRAGWREPGFVAACRELGLELPAEAVEAEEAVEGPRPQEPEETPSP